MTIKTRFASPKDRDLRFVRQSGFKAHEFAEAPRLYSSAKDGLALIGILLGSLAAYGWLA